MNVVDNDMWKLSEQFSEGRHTVTMGLCVSRLLKPISLSGPALEMEITSDQVENGRKSSVVAQKNSNAQLYRYCQIFLAEFFATAFLMFMVCAGCTRFNADPVSPLHSAIASGFAVATLVQAFCHISDCHMNPAVTALFLSFGKIDAITTVVYILAELIGASAGYGVLWALTPADVKNLNMPGHCETLPMEGLSSMAAASIELIITSVLMIMICACLDQRNTHKQDSVPIKFGLTIVTISLCAGTFTGASMNPARSFGPAVWHNQWRDHWVYWVAPVTSGLIVPKIYNYFFVKDFTVKSLN